VSVAKPRVPASRHTFLFEPGTWTASGQFWERGEIECAGQGLSIVRHTSVIWELEGTTRRAAGTLSEHLQAHRPSRRLTYRALAVEEPGDRNPHGEFFVADDTIISSFQSSDGEFVGSEHMTYLAADRYQVRGLFLASGAVVSAWSMELMRKVQGEQ
jgi:hypothetical protein